MRYNSNERQQLADIDRRVEQIAQQISGQTVTASRRSNTVGLKIPFVAFESLLEYDSLNAWYRWRSVGAGWSAGSVVDTGIDPFKTTPNTLFRVYGYGVWLISAAVDCSIATRLIDNTPLRDRVRIETEIDANAFATFPSIFRIRTSDVWESLALNAQQNLGETTATHRVWFLMARNATAPLQTPTPTNYQQFFLRSRMRWERKSFAGQFLSTGREPFYNASIAIWKLDSLISTPVAYTPATT